MIMDDGEGPVRLMARLDPQQHAALQERAWRAAISRPEASEYFEYEILSTVAVRNGFKRWDADSGDREVFKFVLGTFDDDYAKYVRAGEAERVDLKDDFEDFAIRWARGLEDALMRGNIIRPRALRSPGGGGSGAASPRGAHVFQGTFLSFCMGRGGDCDGREEGSSDDDDDRPALSDDVPDDMEAY